MRFTQVGYISDITTNSGTTNGKEWKKTRFKLSVLEYMSREGKNVVRRYWVNTFNNVSVSDGPAMLNLDVVNRKTGRKNDNGRQEHNKEILDQHIQQHSSKRGSCTCMS